jgi:acyl carrier protein
VPDTRSEIITALRAMLSELAAQMGNDSSGLAETDVIPDCEVVDSAGLIEFVIMVDEKYQLGIEAEDMTVDQLGTLGSIADFVLARRRRHPVRAE